MTEPAYLSLARDGSLADRARRALDRLSACVLCPRRCGADRITGIAKTACRVGRHASVHSSGPRHGEEACLSGTRGSGVIQLSGCNLRCLHCQTWEISWQGQGREVTAAELAGMMLGLQRAGCHNINMVSPSHVTAQIVEAVAVAADQGLRLPLVWNSGGYDSLESLELLDGIIDIYLPDAKYGDSAVGRQCSGVRDYAEANRRALAEMRRQVGDLVVDEAGIAVRGLLVRHLVLPNGLAGTAAALANLPPGTAVNVMDQYRPCHKAAQHSRLNRKPDGNEIAGAVEIARAMGLGLIS